METEINERLLSSVQMNMDSAKDVENDLITSLSASEDRLRLVERSMND
jgi:hypothetical protein